MFLFDTHWLLVAQTSVLDDIVAQPGQAMNSAGFLSLVLLHSKPAPSPYIFRIMIVIRKKVEIDIKLTKQPEAFLK